MEHNTSVALLITAIPQRYINPVGQEPSMQTVKKNCLRILIRLPVTAIHYLCCTQGDRATLLINRSKSKTAGFGHATEENATNMHLL